MSGAVNGISIGRQILFQHHPVSTLVHAVIFKFQLVL